LKTKVPEMTFVGMFDDAIKTICAKVCQWLVAGQRFSPVSCTNKADHHDIAEILLNVALNIITLTP
jgi:hypothetical protein